jgi:hypothetical protein
MKTGQYQSSLTAKSTCQPLLIHQQLFTKYGALQYIYTRNAMAGRCQSLVEVFH